jgi:glycosyltransferase involved in cell wall biosynthesis
MSVRLSLVLHDLRVGGAERVMLRLAAGFADKGADVEVVTLRPGGPLKTEIRSGVRHVPLGASRASRAVPRLARYIGVRRPHAVIATLPHVNTIASVAHRLAGAKAMLVLREANDPEREHAFAGPLGGARARFVRWAYARADVIVALTHGNAGGLVRLLGVRPERVVVIPNPAPELGTGSLTGAGTIAPPSGDPATESLLDLGAPAGDPRILCVARLVPQKDHMTLLEAFERFRQRYPGAVLAFVGDGPERARLVERARQLRVEDGLFFAGMVADVAPWWRWADLFVLSSRWEGFPNVLLEALAHGVPIVATDCPTGPREVLDDGRAGVLVPVGDAAALSRGMEEAFLHPPAEEVLRARTRHYAFAAILERWWGLVERPG